MKDNLELAAWIVWALLASCLPYRDVITHKLVTLIHGRVNVKTQA